MELHQLRYVVAVARTGNFSRAAKQCHVTQPSLSQQIQKLEEELGDRLFDRAKLGARLTSAGESFLPRALRILEEVEAAQREARESRGLSRGQVVIGTLPTIAPYFLPAVIALFNAAYPGIQVVVQEDTTARLLKMVQAFEVDLAVVSLPLKETGLESQALFEEELLLAMPPQHALAGKRSIKVRDIESESFIVMKEGHCLGDQVLNFCTRRDFQPNVSCHSAQIETMQSLVEAGLASHSFHAWPVTRHVEAPLSIAHWINPGPSVPLWPCGPAIVPYKELARNFCITCAKPNPGTDKGANSGASTFS